MAVYERTWRPYDGELTSLPLRFLVVTRFALREVFSSRIFVAFYAGCAIPTVVGLALVYLSHNLAMLEKAGIPADFMSGLTLSFFSYLFPWQATPAFFVAVIVSPSLIAADLANNGLPLFLARPINRADYVIGKMAVLFLLLSPVTWMGGLLVFSMQAYFEGGTWWLDHIRIAMAYFVGHVSWILVISLLTLAISAWVRFKPVARGALFGMFFILGGFSQAINAITGSFWGSILNLPEAIIVVVISLFDPANATGPTGLPAWAAWFSLLATALFSLYLLWLKLRAHEVVS